MNCHECRACEAADAVIALVGRPNSGKSALFNRISTGKAVVSNYPGTTVELTRARLRAQPDMEVVDTPGLYSLSPLSEEERVTRTLLLFSQPRPRLVLHVLDAKNLEAALPLTLELCEAGLPVILVLNMADEARAEGLGFDLPRLQAQLGCPAFLTSAVLGEGVAELETAIAAALAAPAAPACSLTLPSAGALAALLARHGVPAPGLPPAERSFQQVLGRLALLGDDEAREALDGLQPGPGQALATAGKTWQPVPGEPAELTLARERHAAARALAAAVMNEPPAAGETFAQRLGRWTMRPWPGLPILALVLYVGLYQIVGSFGAGVLVDFLEGTVFEGLVNPWLVESTQAWVPWAPIRELLAGEYGVLTLGLRYAVGIILPIVTVFFMVFAMIEDSGYLPRLALLLDRLFKHLGLSGRAVIPMILGLGCATMATMVTRTLPSRRERLLATVLLALAIPCSAQLGVMLGVLSGHVALLLTWVGILAGVFLLVGMLGARLMPGERPVFHMEVPPLRLPRPGNVLAKTLARVTWYFQEVLPLFVVASVLIWVGQITGAFAWFLAVLEGPLRFLDLPREAAKVFVFGFFRRDYGAAGLYDLVKAGQLSTRQMVVACVALTLFLPCVAQFLMTVKERGWRAGLAIAGFVLVFAYAAAWVVNQGLRFLTVG